MPAKFLPLSIVAPCSVVLVVSLFLVGCTGSGVSARIKAQPADFAQLPPSQQSAIRNGLVEVGFSPAMVRMALGEPTRIVTEDFPRGESEMWIPDGEVKMWVYADYFHPAGDPKLAMNSQIPTNPMKPASMIATARSDQTQLAIPDLVRDTLLVLFVDDQVTVVTFAKKD
ncbi:MAG: hypothetical protein K9M98_14205 [Cephaloticoccus sp.]|nr:hypothetical protein [Cephaloticoccus sp.]MCF7761648.1 hypothetical protein [Cephaloticoccus sp.]